MRRLLISPTRYNTTIAHSKKLFGGFITIIGSNA